jgi:hypothetical protein
MQLSKLLRKSARAAQIAEVVSTGDPKKIGNYLINSAVYRVVLKGLKNFSRILHL